MWSTAAATLAVLAAGARVPVFGYPPRTFALFLALAVVPTVIGHGLVNRSLRHIPRIPEKLADATIMPIVFIVTFAYVFGSAITIPGGGSYREYLLGGMFAQGAIQPLQGLAVDG